MRYTLLLPLFLIVTNRVLCADTVLLKDGQELKGVVVEDYHDRILVSTERGELCLLKGNIEKIVYGIPEKNLVKLGALYKAQGDYKLSLYYYEAAHRLNPEDAEAQAGALLVTNMLLRKRESDLEKEVAIRQDTEEKMGRQDLAPAEREQLQAERDELWHKAGISIGEDSGYNIQVGRVLEKSPAYEAGVEEGDIIISMWGKLLRYIPLKDVYKLFLQNSASELRIVVLRNKRVALKRGRIFGGAEALIGGRLSMEFEGLTVSEVKPGGPLEEAGIIKGDRLMQLAGASTRYTPLASAYKLIEGAKKDLLSLEIQRELIFWTR